MGGSLAKLRRDEFSADDDDGDDDGVDDDGDDGDVDGDDDGDDDDDDDNDADDDDDDDGDDAHDDDDSIKNTFVIYSFFKGSPMRNTLFYFEATKNLYI